MRYLTLILLIFAFGNKDIHMEVIRGMDAGQCADLSNLQRVGHMLLLGAHTQTGH